MKANVKILNGILESLRKAYATYSYNLHNYNINDLSTVITVYNKCENYIINANFGYEFLQLLKQINQEIISQIRYINKNEANAYLKNKINTLKILFERISLLKEEQIKKTNYTLNFMNLIDFSLKNQFITDYNIKALDLELLNKLLESKNRQAIYQDNGILIAKNYSYNL